MISIGLCECNVAHSELIKSLTTEYFNGKAEIEIQSFSAEDILSGFLSLEDIALDIFILGNQYTSTSTASYIQLINKFHQLFPNCQMVSLMKPSDTIFKSMDTSYIFFVIEDSLEIFYPLALEKIHLKIMQSVPQFLFYKRNQSIYRISLPEIIYLERNKHHTLVHCTNSEHVLVRNLNTLLNQIHLYPYIVRCHNSYAVNLEHVDIYTRNEFVMIQDRHIPISPRYTKDIREKVHALL